MKELRRFAFEGVADELKNPSGSEKPERPPPQTVEEESGDKDCERDEDCRDAECVAQAVYGMLVARRILRNPFAAGASAKHAGLDDTTDFRRRASLSDGVFDKG